MTRITQSMLYARALRDMQASLRDSVRLQEQVATGRRVNRPSDDPAAMLRILPLRRDLRDLDQFTDNTQLAREIADLGGATLQDASDLMQQTRELLVQANNGTTSAADLVGLGGRIDQVLDQMLSLANTSRSGRYLFAGTATDRAPFVLQDGAHARVRYTGNGESVSLEVAPGVETRLNVPGDEIFARRGRGPTTFAGGNTGAAPGGALDSGIGFGELRVTFGGLAGAPPQVTAGTGSSSALGSLTYAFAGGALSVGGGPSVPIPATNQAFRTADGRDINLTVSAPPVPASGTFTSVANLSIDAGATITRVDFSGSSVQVVDSTDGSTLNVAVAALNRTGVESVTYHGTFDPFTLLIAMRDTLAAADDTNRSTTGARLQTLLAEVEGAHDGILNGLTTYGGRSEQMQAVASRVDSLLGAAQQSLSNVEDSDLVESITRMNQHQIVYQASLAVSARIVQTSLLDFLR